VSKRHSHLAVQVCYHLDETLASWRLKMDTRRMR
jgi:hypothetical protein